MPYYILEEFPEESLDNLAKLCDENNLQESQCLHPNRIWSRRQGEGNPISDVSYNLSAAAPLTVQTDNNIDYTNKTVFIFLKKLRVISKQDQIYQWRPKGNVPLDMTLFG